MVPIKCAGVLHWFNIVRTHVGVHLPGRVVRVGRDEAGGEGDVDDEHQGERQQEQAAPEQLVLGLRVLVEARLLCSALVACCEPVVVCVDGRVRVGEWVGG